jgi:hypothetical protein
VDEPSGEQADTERNEGIGCGVCVTQAPDFLGARTAIWEMPRAMTIPTIAINAATTAVAIPTRPQPAGIDFRMPPLDAAPFCWPSGLLRCPVRGHVLPVSAAARSHSARTAG